MVEPRTRTLFAALFFVLVSAATGVGCKFRDELFCCTTPSVCEEAGAPAPTTCQAGFVCDEAGDFGVERTCVPAGAGCVGPSDCVDPARPSCVDRTCVAGCVADDECARFAGATECDTASGRCEACTADGECGTPEAAVCLLDTHTCGDCSTEEQCARFAAAPHCDTASGDCVACRTGASDCTDLSAPVCENGSCRACRSDTDSECPGSGLCDEGTGSCIPEGQVLFVAQSGQDTTAPCERATPCKTVQHAINKVAVGAKRWVVIAPSATPYKEGTVRIQGKTLVLVGTGATLTPLSTGDPAVDVVGAADVDLEGLTIADASSGSGYGVKCENIGAASPRLRLSRVTIARNGGVGITATNCNLAVSASTLTSNAGGGMSLSGVTFAIRNNFIVDNGSSSGGGDFGALRVTSAGANSAFEFNTLTLNESASNFAAGVQCGTTAGGVRIANNIIYRNTSSVSQVQVNGCSVAFNLSEENLGGSNIRTSAEPATIFVGAEDFHIRAGSPAIGAADSGSSVDVDFDGDPRPLPEGSRRDVGADEVP
jgi:hypothetical protein